MAAILEAPLFFSRFFRNSPSPSFFCGFDGIFSKQVDSQRAMEMKLQQTTPAKQSQSQVGLAIYQ